MIENQQQYDRTKYWAERFEIGADHLEEKPTTMLKVDPKLHQAMVQAMRAQAAELRQEMAVWDESHPTSSDQT